MRVRSASFRGAYPSRVWFPASPPENRVGGTPTRTRGTRMLPSKRASRGGCYVLSSAMDFNAFALSGSGYLLRPPSGMLRFQFEPGVGRKRIADGRGVATGRAREGQP